jgi:hypothetical protein
MQSGSYNCCQDLDLRPGTIGVSLYELLNRLGVTLGRCGFRAVTAGMGSAGEEKIRAGKAVAPKQCGNHQGHHHRNGDLPHRDPILAQFR